MNRVSAVHELEVLKHVSAVLGAFACGATGDGKFELIELIASVEGDALLDQECRRELLWRLKNAQRGLTEPTAYRGSVYVGTLGDLASASSYLWERVLPGSTYGGWIYEG